MKKENLALVYPLGILKRYLKFYDEFLLNYLLPLRDELRIVIIAPCNEALDTIMDKYSRFGIETVLIPEAVDIWIRDWAPIPVHFSCGKSLYLKPEFKTSYYSGRYQSFEPLLSKASGKFTEYMDIRTIPLPLKTDGGNFAFNGKDTVVLTNRILENNQPLTKDEIRDIFKTCIGVENVIFIPVEKFDVTGHTDGMLRFIDSETLAVGTYSLEFPMERKFMTNIADKIKENLDGCVKIIRVENFDMMDDENYGIVPSASGNHMNFLKTGKHIFLPDYGIPSSAKSYETLKTHLTHYNIVRVPNKSLFQISKDGGVLNCITWN